MPSHLLNFDWIHAYKDTAYASFHGVDDGYMGVSLLYYSLAYATKAKVCVCLGSGGGLVPLLMRQGQKDAGLQQGKTFLVDGILPESGWGSPQDPGGWDTGNLDKDPLFQEIELIRRTTSKAATSFFGEKGIDIDYLHVDADHSMEGCLNDLICYCPLLKPTGVVTLHDTRYSSVQEAIELFKLQCHDFDVVDFPELAQGVAIARKRVPHDVPPRLFEARPDPEDDILQARRMKAESLAASSDGHTEGKSSPSNE